jgi:hypothetical protein
VHKEGERKDGGERKEGWRKFRGLLRNKSGLKRLCRRGEDQRETVGPMERLPFLTAVLYTGHAYVLGACL